MYLPARLPALEGERVDAYGDLLAGLCQLAGYGRVDALICRQEWYVRVMPFLSGGYLMTGMWNLAPIVIAVEFPNVIALPVLIGRQELSFVFDFDNFEPGTRNPTLNLEL